jgi:hypothetical protein
MKINVQGSKSPLGFATKGDGSWKIFAASRAKRPFGLLSILALDRGISGPEQHAKLIAAQKVESEDPANGSQQK